MKGSCAGINLRLAAALLAMTAAIAAAQQAPVTTPAPVSAAQTAAAKKNAEPANKLSREENPEGISSRDLRHAAKLFLQATKLFEKEKFDQAMQDYEQAAALDPGNADYAMAARVARSHAVTALIQIAAKARLRGDAGAARAALQQALELDPRNAQVAEHLQGMADSVLTGQPTPIYEQASSELGEPPTLAPSSEVHSFHERTDMRQLILNFFKVYGIQATVDSSVPAKPVRLDLDNVKFAQAARVLSLVTDSFWVTLDAHRVLVAKDTRENRLQFVREEMETVYLSGLTTKEMTDVGTLAKTVFNAPHAIVSPSAGTLTLRAPPSTMDAFNTTLRLLLDGHSQVELEVRMIQLAHTNQQNTGAGLPQQITAFNVYAEEQAILNANQSLVQQIISSGLAAPGDNLAILGILLASGQVSSSLFSNGIALFGGGLTLSGLSPGPTTLNLSLNSSDSRELDQIQVRLGDGEEGTLLTGMRYPIMTSSFTGLSSSNVNIPGLTSAGSSSNLSSLLSSLAGAATQIPQVEYQDLGLTLKATPKVMRGGDVALTLDVKITALAGASVNGVPVLNNRDYSGVVTLREGSAVVVASELDKQESRALSGVPGISEIPGMNNLTGKETEKDYATLLIIISPHVIRGTQAAGRSPMMRIERHMSAQ